MHISVVYVRNYKTVSLRNFFNRQRLSQMEKQATLIMSNPKFKIAFIVVAALLMTAFAPGPALAVANPFDKFGWTAWGYIKTVGRFACLIMGGVEVIKSLSSGDTKSIAKILFKYLIAYATFTILPWMFDELDRSFKL